MGQQGRSGPRLGVSVLTTQRAKPFSDSRGHGKGRIRRPDGASSSASRRFMGRRQVSPCRRRLGQTSLADRPT
jgi:hypothetical protein